MPELFSYRRAENYANAARRIICICNESHRQQTVFLESLGLTWIVARAMNEQERATLQAKWDDYRLNY